MSSSNPPGSLQTVVDAVLAQDKRAVANKLKAVKRRKGELESAKIAFRELIEILNAKGVHHFDFLVRMIEVATPSEAVLIQQVLNAGATYAEKVKMCPESK